MGVNAPRVSVLLPVCNAEGWVGETVRSLREQTFGDFEVIAVDDGSGDGSLEDLRVAEREDKRFRVVTRENRGLVATLNEAMGMARGEYWARIDADDLCMPERLERQAGFLDSHADVAVAGSAVELFSECGEPVRLDFPTDANVVGARLLFRNALAHPAVMMRAGVLRDKGLRYREPYRIAQDYDLWIQCVAAGLRLTNMGEVLTRYRVHGGQMTQAKARETQEEGVAIREWLLRVMDARVSVGELLMHRQLGLGEFMPEEGFVRGAVGWLERLSQVGARLFEREALMRVLTGRCVAVLRFAREHGVRAPRVEGTAFAAYVHAGALE